MTTTTKNEALADVRRHENYLLDDAKESYRLVARSMIDDLTEQLRLLDEGYMVRNPLGSSPAKLAEAVLKMNSYIEFLSALDYVERHAGEGE